MASNPHCVLQQGARDRVNVLLLSLAVADLAKLLVLLVLQVDCVVHLVMSVRDAGLWESVTKFQVGQYYRFFNLVSAQLNTVMALDRALAVSLPLTAHRILSFG